MQKFLILSLILMAVLPAGIASAANVTVQNYFYTHTNQPGTHYFKDKYGNDRQYGDNIQKDAVINAIVVSAQGLASGDQIVVQTGSGQTYQVTPGEHTNLSVAKNDYIRIALIKSGYNEVFAKLDNMYTFDDSGGGTNVNYSYSVNDIPTEYGDLGPGTAPGEDTAPIINGNYYYFEPLDLYRYDYNPPSGVSYYQLHFDSPSGEHYMRQFDQTPTGIHYLTCNGSYVMRFYDASGTVIAKSPDMVTGQIQSPTCNSQPGTGDTGYHDINASMDLSSSICTMTWQDIAADFYEIYRNGQYVIGVQGLLPIDYGSIIVEQIPCLDGSYTLIALKNGSIIGQTDFQQGFPANPGGGGGDPGGGSGDDCNGCKLLTDWLACPAWDQYMGDWESMLRGVIPPPPNWQEVANIMRDTIVPAIGQELVNRAPVVAEIFADEFESREDPVYPPGSLATYNPPYQVPQMQDMNQQITFDLNSGVPSFEPDYTGSQTFTIPDPLNIEFSDTDAGYNAPDPQPSNNQLPVYSAGDPAPETDPGYTGSANPVDDDAIPGYVITNPVENDPERAYNPPSPGDSGQIPGYQLPSTGGAGMIPDYQLPSSDMPDYQLPS